MGAALACSTKGQEDIVTDLPRSMSSNDRHRPSLRDDQGKLLGGGSFFRVGSKVLKPRSDNNSSNNKDDEKLMAVKASTYNHVHSAVELNFNEAHKQQQQKTNGTNGGGLLQHDGGKPLGTVGLRNLGNTCFMNSSLQCLSNTIPLTDYFLGYDYRKEINRENFLGTKGELVTAYAKLVKAMWLGKRDVVDPSSFKSKLSKFAPQFQGYHQHDAQELLGFLLDGIHEDMNRVHKRPYVEDKDCDGTNDEADAIEAWKNYLQRNKSLVVDMFQGQLRNTCQCRKCGHRNIRFEPFMYLSLPISDSCRTLQDCLDLYTSQDDLVGANQWYCEKCKTHVDATKKIDLWILPPILIFHLKRFKYDEYGKVGSKNPAVIEYKLQDWDLSRSVRSKGAAASSRFDLYAISNHVGGLGSGHYTAHALNRFDDNWYEFNDSSVHRINNPSNASSSAYLLFYNRSDPHEQQPPPPRRDCRSPRPITRKPSPLIRRQSISRPDLWPHAQVSNYDNVREYRRFSSKNLAANNHPTIVANMPSTVKMPSVKEMGNHDENDMKNDEPTIAKMPST